MLRRIYEIIECEDNEYYRLFNKIIVMLIILNVFAVILESFAGLYDQYNTVFRTIELMSVAIFSVEYILRLLTAKYKYPDKSPGKATIAFVFSFMALIDLLAVLPFYFPLFFKLDLRFLRILRLIRIFRILKLSRYTKSLQVFGNVLRKRKEDLLIVILVLVILLIAASSLMYYLENPAQPDKFPNIAASLWWGIATLTTVGYGDIYPITVAGKVVSGIISVLGIGFVALPTGIISSGFLEEIQNNRKSQVVAEEYQYCPHCGKKIKE
ncbi:MAG: ion transporter [Clostridiaceae bacterium]